MKKFYISIILLLDFINSKVSLEIIKKVNKEILPERLDCTIFNPLLAYLLLKNGFISNNRFFNSDLIPSYNISGERNYSEDKGTTSFTKGLLLLFPSPIGILNCYRTTNFNFANNFFTINKKTSKEKLIKNIEDLVNILIKIHNNEIIILELLSLKKGVEYELGKVILTNTTENEKIQNKRILKGEKNENIEFSKAESKNIENMNVLKIILINAFIVSVLEGEEQYTEYISKLSKALNGIHIEPEYITNEEKRGFNELYDLDKPSFPFSRFNQPESNMTILSYNRKTDKFGGNQSFSDCIDITILNLCICLCWDYSTESFNFDHLQLDEDSLLKNFFIKHGNEIFPITMEIRNAWSRVIQDLDDNAFQSYSKFKPQIIQYVKNYRNELEIGFINIMSILTKIFTSSKNNIKNKYIKLFNDDNITEYNIAEKFIKFLNILANPKKLTIKEDDIEKKLSLIEIGCRKDFKGCFNIIFHTITQKKTFINTMKLDITKSHGALYYVSNITDIDDLSILKKFKNLMDNKKETIFNYLTKSYIYFLGNKKIEYLEDNSDIKSLYLYSQGQLINNEQKRNCLLNLIDIVYNNDSSEEIKEEGRRVGENILRSACLSDLGTEQYFLKFYCFSEKLLSSLNNEKKYEIWKELYKKYNKTKYRSFRNAWNNVIINQNFECTLNLSSSHYFNGDAFEMLRITTSSLKKLILSYYNINQFENFCELLLEYNHSKMPFIESLSICYINNLTDRHIDILNKIFEIHNKVKSLSFERCSLETRIIKLILNNLIKNRKLKSLSFWDEYSFDDDSIKIITDILMSKDSVLNTLEFLHIKLDDIKIGLISQALRNNCSLEFLNLKNTDLNPCRLKLITTALKKNYTLKSLNISENSLDRPSIQLILDGLKENKALEVLDISFNSFNCDDIICFINSLIKQGTELKQLIIIAYYDSDIEKINKYLENNSNNITFQVVLN